MHDSSALPLDRRQQIADRLTRGQPVVSGTLAAEFGVSEDAIRRDLRALADDGLCQRVYGGALPLSRAAAPMQMRAGQDVARKRALARGALPMITPGMTLFLDAGSTTLQLAGLLPGDMGLRVVTNSLPAAAALMHRSDLSLIVIGGLHNPGIGACVDSRALDQVQRFCFDLCFLGACALSLRHGLAAFDLGDAEIKRALPDQSSQTVLLMTNAKLDTAAPFAIGPISTASHYLLEADAPAATVAAIRACGPAVTLAPPC